MDTDEDDEEWLLACAQHMDTVFVAASSGAAGSVRGFAHMTNNNASIDARGTADDVARNAIRAMPTFAKAQRHDRGVLIREDCSSIAAAGKVVNGSEATASGPDRGQGGSRFNGVGANVSRSRHCCRIDRASSGSRFEAFFIISHHVDLAGSCRRCGFASAAYRARKPEHLVIMCATTIHSPVSWVRVTCRVSILAW